MAKFAFQDLNAKRAVVLTNTGNKYSPALARFFIESFRKLGGKIVWEGDYLEKVTDFDLLIDKVKSFQHDVVFVPGYYKDSAMIIKKSKKAGITATFIGGDGWGGDLIYDYAGSELYGSYYSAHWHNDFPNKKSQDFQKRYTKKHGEIKYSGVALSYDATMILADAVHRAGSLDPASIRKALSETKNFEGTTGKISFNSNGDSIKPVVILKLDKGTSFYVKTILP